jgi:hypothetical protein
MKRISLLEASGCYVALFCSRSPKYGRPCATIAYRPAPPSAQDSETGPCDKCQGSGKLFDRRVGDVVCDECHGHGWFNAGVAGPAEAAPHEWLCAVNRGGKCTCSVLDAKPCCTVCDKPHAEHGSFPTCASHPYSPDGTCGHIGTFANGKFTGASCAGVECRNGCVRAFGGRNG